jgi:hypothetical protein
MTSSIDDPDFAGSVEVFLTKKKLEVSAAIFGEGDKEISSPWERGVVDSTSMRGAQREVTSALLRRGFEAVDRWTWETRDSDESDLGETVRTFRRKAQGSNWHRWTAPTGSDTTTGGQTLAPQIEQYLREHPASTYDQIAEGIGEPRSTVTGHMREASNSGTLFLEVDDATTPFKFRLAR